MATNNRVVLVGGKSKGGKTTSLRNLRDPEAVMYLNCEANKDLTFAAKFRQFTITNPYEIYDGFNHAAQSGNFHTIVVDTLSFLMEMFHTLFIHKAADGMKGWADYQAFFKKLMQQYVASATVNVVFLAHVHQVLNEEAMVMEKTVPIQGNLKKNGVEAYFSTVVSARRMSITELDQYQNDLLVITEKEKMMGVKHVYQTELTKETVHERISSSMGMWEMKETFIDSDVQLVLDRLEKYHGPRVKAA